MKRISLVLILSLLLAFVLPFAASAEGNRVEDWAMLLSQEERAALEETAAGIQSSHDAEVLILTVDSLNGLSAENYADSYYISGGFQEDGILLLLAMTEREWYIYTSGSVIYRFTDRDIQNLGGALAEDLGKGNYFLAFDHYLDALPSYLGSSPVSTDTTSPLSESTLNLPLSALIGFIVALVTVLVMVSSMNTKRKQGGASEYMESGSFHLLLHQDLFLYSKVDKVRKQESASSGSRTTVHRSSGGRSHGGGVGKY